jgi:hypothetical protein
MSTCFGEVLLRGYPGRQDDQHSSCRFMHVIPGVLLFLRISLDICRFKACLPALFGTVQYETLIPVLFCMLVASGPPLYGGMDSCLSRQSGARRVRGQRGGCIARNNGLRLSGHVSPWMEDAAPAQEWCGCLGRQPFITRKQGGLAALG